MSVKHAFYAQSGGVTAVINASACAVIETARRYDDKIGKVYAGHNGILGALREELIDTSLESHETIGALLRTPGGAFGSCRYKLKPIGESEAEYRRLIEVFRAHDIGYFFYNGGNDSMDTALKVSQLSEQMGYPLTCIGVPKTIDNDLTVTDNCPGFGSAAKYLAVSTKEASHDIASMCDTSTKVFVMEVMGRNAGWLAAAAGLAARQENDPPHIIVFPEIPLNRERFLQKVKETTEQEGYCVIVASEGARYEDGSFVSASTTVVDSFGHQQLGGVAPALCTTIKQELGYKYHYAVADYLQRSARHIASRVDVEQAYAVGKAAVELAVTGRNAVMSAIIRESNAPYRWSVGEASLDKVANFERKMPMDFITEDSFGITRSCREYLEPLIEGEEYPAYLNGLPRFARLKKVMVEKRLNKPFEL
ncbi:6-phosphofructokinase [Endozoicomonas montiporae]|uniref:Pyrophosphate--fructose 6-phosphate 1-phosphotransferase n=2 Tax=Endozoicomonas montiporae TaxID=1027273 RepID=A0A081N921_9GAMM|nr:6-phosphofructokinase [Endozoicomonas montiporae]AMO55124.1 6-phosphofructokinase [Endozoicomonas montiporae CL-33]KEQ14944.1 6-phosphofructokinase [Endozoicomonas montiporae]